MDSGDKELENKLIGMAILDKDCAIKLVSLSIEYYEPMNNLIIEATNELLKENKPIDIVTIKNKNKEIPGTYLANITENIITIAHFDYYLDIYINIYKKNKIKSILLKADQVEIDDIVKEINDINIINKKENTSYDDIFLESAEKMKEEKDIIYSGYGNLDNLTGGFKKTNLVVISAPPKTGKSTFALNLLDRFAKNNLKILYFSFEMSKLENAIKIMSMNSMKQIKNKDDYLENYKFIKKGLKVDIIDGKTMSVFEIRAMVKNYNPDIIFIDQLDCIPCPQRERYDISVGEVVIEIKNIAIEMEKIIFLMHQLNRDSMKSESPELYHLKNSQIVEQKADMVLGLKRDKEKEYANNSDWHDLNIYVMGNRMGSEGKVTLKINPKISLVREV